MWELGNLWAHEAGTSNTIPVSITASSYLSVMHEIHVLVVDHDSENLINTAKLLESCQYRVTIAEVSSGALQILSSAKVRIDIIMANINSPDLHGFKLLQQAALMEIPVVLMSTDDNAFMAMRAIENGAYIYLKKPAPREVLKCLWQHVVREKIKSDKEKELLLAASFGRTENPNAVVGGPGGIMNSMMMMDKGKSKTSDNYWENHMSFNSSKLKRKVCTEWTQELHEKFMYAVETLGEGRCFPKEILEIMNVPGLTRMQVASHLQKCRNDNWRSPDERKSLSSAHNGGSDPENTASHKPRRFGSMPKATKTASKETSGGGEVMRTPQSVQNDGGGVDNMDNVAVAVVSNDDPNPQYHPQYGTMVPLHLAATTPPPRNTSSEDHYFNFTDMDCLVQNNYPGPPGMTNIASSSAAGGSGSGGGYHFEPPYNHHHEQSSSKAPIVDSRSPWSSETTSNFGSEHGSDTKGH